MEKIIKIGSLLCALGVIIGAFGAHGFENILTQNGRTETFETGVFYHFIHSMGIILAGIICGKIKSKYLKYSVWFFAAGIILFSGSLYVLSITNITFLGMVAPLGGTSFILGWIFMAMAMRKNGN